MSYTKTKIDLDKEFKDQLELIDNSIRSYDNGSIAESKNLATRLRVLLHDTNNSKSLLTSLEIKDKLRFVDTSIGKRPGPTTIGHFGLTLVHTAFDNPIPILNEFPNIITKVTFDNWWSKPVIHDMKGKFLTRKQLVLNIADQDGGAHVDPTLRDEVYLNMKYFASLGLFFGDGTSYNLADVLPGSLRQIAHEFRLTVDDKYRCDTESLYKDRHGLIVAGIRIEFRAQKPKLKRKIGRNVRCPCGSELRYKNCCLTKQL